MKWTWGAVAALSGGFLIAGCGSNTGAGDNGATSMTSPGEGGATAGGGQELTGAGATFPYPLYSKWFDAYNQAKGVKINYQSIGSGGGIQQLKNKTVDFGASDAPLDDKALKEMPGDVVHIPTVAGSVVVAYNLPGLKSGLKLTGENVAGIYLGKIKKWDDPAIAANNAGMKLPATPIAVVHRSDGSGTSNIFTGYLSAVSPEWKQKVGAGKSVDWPVGLGGKGNEGVTGVLQKTPGAVGYVELAYAEQNKLNYASLKNKSGNFVAPSVDATTAAIAGAIPELQKDIRAPLINAAGAEAYPIAGLTYILAYKKMDDAAKSQTLVDFLKWAMTDGQGMAKDLYYAPLPPEVTAINEKTIDSLS